MNNEFEKLEVFYLQSTFIKDCCDYIKSRDDYPLFKNLYTLIKINNDASSVDFNKIKNMYFSIFKNLSKYFNYFTTFKIIIIHIYYPTKMLKRQYIL